MTVIGVLLPLGPLLMAEETEIEAGELLAAIAGGKGGRAGPGGRSSVGDS